MDGRLTRGPGRLDSLPKPLTRNELFWAAMSEMQTAPEERALAISASAARRVAELRKAEGDDSLMLRVTLSAGGCAGFQYGFEFDSAINPDDHVFERDGVKVVIDEISLDLLKGSEVDYVEELVGSYFALKNPNAASTCGCGVSFSV